MTRQVRLAIFAVAGAGLAALLFWAVAGLPDFGHYHWPYGHVINRLAVPERHATNAVTTTVFDVRGFDTLGEEFILFTAVAGVAMLLRKWHEGEHEPPDEVRSDALRLLGALAAPAVLLLGLWVIAFGLLTPGGGFQGGVVVGGAILLAYVTGGYLQFQRVTPYSPVELAEAFGVGAYAVLGFVGIAVTGTYLGNFLGLGKTGTLRSGGSIPLLNWATAIEVAAAMLILFDEFLKLYMVPASDWHAAS